MSPKEMKQRTKDFALRGWSMCNDIEQRNKTHKHMHTGEHIAGQLRRCSSSVAANYRAACLAQSKAGFVAKLSIVIEDVDESAFWIEFATSAGYINQQGAEGLLNEAKELTSIFIASRKTSSNSQ